MDDDDPNPLIGIQRSLSAAIREKHVAPPADKWDEERFPFGVAPGGNKIGLKVCAICGKPPTLTPRNDLPVAFLFFTELSAREYRISGMCQACQDSIFGGEVDEG
jgi:hypothetical protein